LARALLEAHGGPRGLGVERPKAGRCDQRCGAAHHHRARGRGARALDLGHPAARDRPRAGGRGRVMPKQVCVEPSCAEFAFYRGRCRHHAQQREASRRGRRDRRVYMSLKWKATRSRVLFEHPICPCGALANEVDHIVPLELGGAPFSRDNLQALCPTCHSRKTRQEQALISKG
jgi:5-methylcytosine-specific restriction endonuclease McrA